ncbi:MAG TPA: adenosine deaminase family protein [Kiritimatiellia bacterium]|jgi:adenosine deaminase|nr:adenosine deaminase family protein [Kiritimatiellia bacterium]OQC56261.1 MAG: Aminodeoxyfutalosine deaminase [Verrucomicrobia bacterium ADurb.Bin018]HOE00731.1 adenosine deaminase family protein [Kiritimatiellia bacterium]HOE37489.1 adenosine deaminase family protein [Kiritimatiellia bacterium]HOR74736.1 adenosine deaminase family protein [Kiritimatiellia bacterium]
MKTKITREFLEKIPKTDLHLHLDGSLRLNTLIELAKAAKVPLPSETESGLQELVFKEKYQDLPDYLRGFGLTCAVLQTPENLERVAYELAVDSMAENVRYIEVRYAPQLHIRPGFTVEEVIECVNRGLARAQQEHNASAAVKDGRDIPFHYGIITCAMRFFNRHMSAYYAQLFDVMPHTPAKEVMAIASLEMARAAANLAHTKGIPVVGFDLAGAEAGFPAIDHKEAYQYAHVHFLKKTVHAGEAYGPESIFQAITECHADRIGHGTFLFAADKIKDPAIKDPEYYVRCLVEHVASRRITLEVCPTSNLQTIPAITSVAEHPLRKMLEASLSVSICTDNRLVSRTSVTRELELVCSQLPVTPAQLRNIILAGFKGSFFPGPYSEKRALVRQVINRYEALEKQYLKA